jgi:hypothetical protein
MDRGSKEWRKLASALYSLAHSDAREFHALEPELKNTPVGQLCARYLESKEFEMLDQAGRLLTGTKQWYIYIGCSM